LKKERFALFVLATHYEGDPPDSCVQVWEALQKLETSPILRNTKFIAFGLGDLTYKHFCGFAKNVCKLLEELGATQLLPMGTASNDQGKIEKGFIEWKDTIWETVQKNVSPNPGFKEGQATPTAQSSYKYVVVPVQNQQETDLDSITNLGDYDTNSSVLFER
jgi:sulfite reductase alpha subunit-like flavoprotein